MLLFQNPSNEVVNSSRFPLLQTPFSFCISVSRLWNFRQQQSAATSAQDGPGLVTIESSHRCSRCFNSVFLSDSRWLTQSSLPTLWRTRDHASRNGHR